MRDQTICDTTCGRPYWFDCVYIILIRSVRTKEHKVFRQRDQQLIQSGPKVITLFEDTLLTNFSSALQYIKIFKWLKSRVTNVGQIIIIRNVRRSYVEVIDNKKIVVLSFLFVYFEIVVGKNETVAVLTPITFTYCGTRCHGTTVL